MIYFFTVVSPPRSGTQWYSQVFSIEHSFCFHELTTRLRPYPSNIALSEYLAVQAVDHTYEQGQRGRILQSFPEYFSRHWEQSICGHKLVGNSDCFGVYAAPGLWLLWPDMRFVFSVRNGINVVQSINQLAPNTPFAHWDKGIPDQEGFAGICRYWVAQVQAYCQSLEWLTERNALIQETRLETMTSDPQEFRRIWEWLDVGPWEKHAERNLKLMQTPVNVRTNQTRVLGPTEIWQSWTLDQRATFREICSTAMRRLHYSIPDD